MAKVGNLVQETTTSTGTGNLTVSSVNGKRTFNTEFSTGGTDVFYYFISHQSAAEWEVGTGHLSAATTFVRDTVIASSNAGAAVNFSAGTKDVVNDIPAVNQMSGLNTGTAAITIGNSDLGKTVELTGSTSRTFAFSAAATLGDGWWCRIINSSTAEITLDPNGGELIDGLANFKMYPNECRLVRCSGTAFKTIVLHPFYLTIAQAASPFTFTKPPGYNAFGTRLGGSGGSGGKASAANAGGGGGGGSTFEGSILASAVGTTETITIGAGGAAQTTANSNGNAGNNTTFGSLATAYGGGRGGGSAAANSGGGGAGLSAVGGNATSLTAGDGGAPGGGAAPTNAAGVGYGGAGGGSGGDGDGSAGGAGGIGGGGGGAGTSTSGTGTGGSAFSGGGGGGGAGAATAGAAGGASKLGGNGGAGGFDANNATDGAAGTNGYAGGGGGGSETGTSGAGGNGSAAIWGIA